MLVPLSANASGASFCFISRASRPNAEGSLAALLGRWAFDALELHTQGCGDCVVSGAALWNISLLEATSFQHKCYWGLTLSPVLISPVYLWCYRKD